MLRNGLFLQNHHGVRVEALVMIAQMTSSCINVFFVSMGDLFQLLDIGECPPQMGQWHTLPLWRHLRLALTSSSSASFFLVVPLLELGLLATLQMPLEVLSMDSDPILSAIFHIFQPQDVWQVLGPNMKVVHHRRYRWSPTGGGG